MPTNGSLQAPHEALQPPEEDCLSAWACACGPYIADEGASGRDDCASVGGCDASAKDEFLVSKERGVSGVGLAVRSRAAPARRRGTVGSARAGGGAATIAACSVSTAHAFAPGDLLQALPGAQRVDEGGLEIYRAGDEGTVSRVCSGPPRGDSLEITWARTGRTWHEDAPREHVRFLLRQTLAIGDLLLTLPGRCCSVNGAVACVAGDEVSVVRFGPAGSPGAQEEHLEVVCARTGKACSVSRASWTRVFRFLRRQTLEVGDLLQVLPGARPVRNAAGEEVYAEGDEGSVTRFYVRRVAGEAGGGGPSQDGAHCRADEERGQRGAAKERMELIWARSGLKSEESAAQWMRCFRLVPKAACYVAWPNRFSKGGGTGSACGARGRSSPRPEASTGGSSYAKGAF